MIFLPRANNWGWNTIHFGASLFHLSSITLICLVPCLCFLLYSSLPLLIRASIFFVYAASHVIWCSRFFKFYEKVNSEPDIASLLYQEEDDAIYYMQQVDKYLIEKKYKFRQSPKDRYFFVSALLAFLLLFFMNPMRTVVGLPFIHIFFLVSTFPISLMAAGFATRSWLIFYYYPKQMRRRTSKQTYVDMGSKSQFI
jgi:hypothetical protein